MNSGLLRIGIDFDNTIVDYRPVFAPAARELFSLAGGAMSKAAIRDLLRARPGGETDWQRLQAHVYGVALAEAPAYEGFETFVREARGRGAALYVVSHKSRFAAAAPDGPDLRAAAARWLAARRIALDAVYFEDTRAGKLCRVSELGLTHFVDDLEEVLLDPAFPRATAGIHFRDSWEAVRRELFG